jgi:hypothetical protein
MYTFLIRMTDTMTSQNIDRSSCDTLDIQHVYGSCVLQQIQMKICTAFLLHKFCPAWISFAPVRVAI